MNLQSYGHFTQATTMQDENLVQLIMARPNYHLFQEKGQRYYKLTNWNNRAPPAGCEAFIGRLPRDCFEDEIVPLFEPFGTIYCLRVMMEFSGANRGFAFVKFTQREAMLQACRWLDNYEIRPGSRIGVKPSFENNRLFIRQIPFEKTSMDIFHILRRYTRNVVKVVAVRDINNPALNRGYCFVIYRTHQDAATARRVLCGNFNLDKLGPIVVEWARPQVNGPGAGQI